MCFNNVKGGVFSPMSHTQGASPVEQADAPPVHAALAAWMCSSAVVSVHPQRQRDVEPNRVIVARALQHEREQLETALAGSDAARALSSIAVTPMAVVHNRGNDGVALLCRWSCNGEGRGFLVAFCKTTSFNDVVHDLDLLYAPYGDAMVHRGFYRKLQSIQKSLTQLVHRWREREPGAAWIFCGHSLGGAMALLASVQLREALGVGAGREPVALEQLGGVSSILFGAPRVGDADFARLVQTSGVRVYRVAHPLDIVPAMLPAPWYVDDTPNWPPGRGDASRLLTNFALFLYTFRHHNGHHRSAQYRPLFLSMPQ